MSGDLNPAILFLQQKVDEAERKANELRGALNVLRVESGLAPVEANASSLGEGAGGGATLASIREDTFYGKVQQTAIREYLEMRKVAGMGPAKPREIFDALTKGGFSYDAKSEDIAMVGMRALLRKRSHVFHKLPNGAYGMTAWYPNARTQKVAAGTSAQADDDDDDEDTPASAAEGAADAG